MTLLSSCTVGPDFQSPLPPTTTQYTRHPINNKHLHFTTETLSQEWWQLFHSPFLDNLINEALHHNQTFASALSTLKEAQQNLNATAGTQLPQVDGSLAATGERVAPAEFGFDSVSASNFVLYNASVDVSYNLDLFGKLRRQVESYHALAEYQMYQMQGARLTLSSNVATSAFQLAMLYEQLSTTHAIIQAQKKLVSMAQQQRKGILRPK